jgi:hypothetical protein
MDELPIDTAKPSGQFTVPILRNADLAGRMYLKLQVPALGSTFTNNGATQVAWVRRLGHAIIDYITINIGGTDIDKHYGTWLDIFYELTHTSEQERGYNAMIGDVPSLTTLGTNIPAYTLYIPLQFWFNRNPGLALPLIALQYHDVRLYVSLAPITTLINWSGSQAPAYTTISAYNTATIMVDYIYLDSEERRRFAQVGHEYLIEQVQYPGKDSINASMGSTVVDKEKLNFNHPCKELIWAVRAGAYNGADNVAGTTSRGRFLSYTNNDNAWSTAVNQAAANLAYGTFQGGYSNSTGSGWTSSTFRLPTGTTTTATSPNIGYIYAPPGLSVTAGDSAFFSTTATTSNSNTLNIIVTLINTSTATITFSGTTANNVILQYVNNPLLYVPASSGSTQTLNLLDALSTNTTNSTSSLLGSASSVINLTVEAFGSVNGTYTYGTAIASGAGPVVPGTNNHVLITQLLPNVVVTGHNLQLRDVSVPLGDAVDNRYTASIASTGQTVTPTSTGFITGGYRGFTDVTLVQPNNYGLSLDGSGNPVASGNIQLNGHDRFDQVLGNYFNYVQPYQHHTRTPADGINVYSFGLHPEQHQPSGTANLSRIDTTVLNLTFSDGARAGNYVPLLNFVQDCYLYVFAVNYNVLRVMSGMAGLAYSN